MPENQVKMPKRNPRYGHTIEGSEFFIPAGKDGWVSVAVVHHGENVKVDIRSVYIDKNSGDARFGKGLRVHIDAAESLIEILQRSVFAALGGTEDES